VLTGARCFGLSLPSSLDTASFTCPGLCGLRQRRVSSTFFFIGKNFQRSWLLIISPWRWTCRSFSALGVPGVDLRKPFPHGLVAKIDGVIVLYFGEIRIRRPLWSCYSSARARAVRSPADPFIDGAPAQPMLRSTPVAPLKFFVRIA